jgi:2-hydroxychromene-2-carboxylate isomerase
MRPAPSMAGQSTPRPTFYFDLGSPYAYLAAERVNGLFAERGLEAPEWQPILLGALFKRFERGSWAQTPERDAGIAEVERRAASYGLPELRWPDPFPGNTLVAMRAATFAKQTGRTVAFALAAFRQAFAAGRDLSDPENVLIAAAACELHPNAVRKAVESAGVKDALREATDTAGDLGVKGVPSVVVGGNVFWGDDRLEDALAAASAT